MGKWGFALGKVVVVGEIVGGGLTDNGRGGAPPDVGIARVVELLVFDGPLVLLRVGDGGGLTGEVGGLDPEVEGTLGRAALGVRAVDTWPAPPEKDFFVLIAGGRGAPLTAGTPSELAMLRVSLPSQGRSKLPLVNGFHSHSSPRPRLPSVLALHPAPTPSTASLGSSCSLKSSQLAYTHFNSQ